MSPVLRLKTLSEIRRMIRGPRFTMKPFKSPHEVEVLFTGMEPEAVRYDWCEANITDRFTTRNIGMDENFVAYRVLYTFKNPDDAFAFKMRWG